MRNTKMALLVKLSAIYKIAKNSDFYEESRLRRCLCVNDVRINDIDNEEEFQYYVEDGYTDSIEEWTKEAIENIITDMKEGIEWYIKDWLCTSERHDIKVRMNEMKIAIELLELKETL